MSIEEDQTIYIFTLIAPRMKTESGSTESLQFTHWLHVEYRLDALRETDIYLENKLLSHNHSRGMFEWLVLKLLLNVRFLDRAMSPSAGFYWQQHVQVGCFVWLYPRHAVCLSATAKPCRCRGCADRCYCWYVDSSQTRLQVILQTHWYEKQQLPQLDSLSNDS